VVNANPATMRGTVDTESRSMIRSETDNDGHTTKRMGTCNGLRRSSPASGTRRRLHTEGGNEQSKYC
jgi:hypothetical protein